MPGLINYFLAAAIGLFVWFKSLLEHHPKRVAAIVAAMLTSAGGFAVASLAPDVSDQPVRQVIESVQPSPLSQQYEVLENHAFRLYRSEQTRSTDSVGSLLRRLGIDDPAASA